MLEILTWLVEDDAVLDLLIQKISPGVAHVEAVTLFSYRLISASCGSRRWQITWRSS